MSEAKEVLKMWVNTINNFPKMKTLIIHKGEFDILKELLKELEGEKVIK